MTSNAPSLAEIQRMEEERQMIMIERMKQIQAHEQHLQQQQRGGSGWSEKRYVSVFLHSLLIIDGLLISE